MDEGDCNSDWAIATVGGIEGAYYVFSGTQKELRRLSPQQIVDCATEQSNCWGGSVAGAIDYTLDFPLEELGDYPYTQAMMQPCQYKENLGSVQVSDCRFIPSNQPWDIVDWLYTGPVVVQLDASRILANYKGGIFRDGSCGTTLNHAALVVGWGVQSGVNFFIIKNSWGNQWGEQGYMRFLLADGPGICGMNQAAYQPYVHDPV